MASRLLATLAPLARHTVVTHAVADAGGASEAAREAGGGQVSCARGQAPRRRRPGVRRSFSCLFSACCTGEVATPGGGTAAATPRGSLVAATPSDRGRRSSRPRGSHGTAVDDAAADRSTSRGEPPTFTVTPVGGCAKVSRVGGAADKATPTAMVPLQPHCDTAASRRSEPRVGCIPRPCWDAPVLYAHCWGWTMAHFWLPLSDPRRVCARGRALAWRLPPSHGHGYLPSATQLRRSSTGQLKWRRSLETNRRNSRDCGVQYKHYSHPYGLSWTRCSQTYGRMLWVERAFEPHTSHPHLLCLCHATCEQPANRSVVLPSRVVHAGP